MAISNASPGDRIYVAGGVFFEAITLRNGTQIYGGYEGISGAPGNRDIRAFRSVVNGSSADAGAPADHVVFTSGVTNTVLNGLTITGGVANGWFTTPHDNGGGIYCENVNASNTIADCTITSNTVNDSGGGIFCVNSSPLISGCAITSNVIATGSSGGGAGIGLRRSSPQITGCLIAANAARDGGWGGGLYSDAQSSPTLFNCAIINNCGHSGGGVYVWDSSVQLTSCVLEGNYHTYHFGSGVYCGDGASAELLRCVIRKHSAGGIVCMNGSRRVTVDDCVIAQNSAAPGMYGGGVYSMYADITIRNSRITGNTAEFDGGGICIHGPLGVSGEVLLENSVVSGNVAGGSGGGVSCAHTTVTVRSCTINCNQAETAMGGGVDCLACQVTITESTVAGNSANGVFGGGGLWFQYCDVLISGCSVIANSSLEANGGGLYVVAPPVAGICGIADSRISGNQSSGNLARGGGLYVSVGPGTSFSLSLTNCIITGNAVRGNINAYGGGLCLLPDLGGVPPFAITNCTISDNYAPVPYRGVGLGGAGLWCVWNSRFPITNTIFSGNSDGAIGGTDESDVPVLRNCLFSNNARGDVDGGSTFYTGADEINGNLPGASGNVDGDPVFIMAPSGRWTESPVVFYDPDSGTTRTLLTDGASSFAPGSLAGKLINANTTQPLQTLILSNATTTIEVIGDVSDYVTSVSQYRIYDYHLALSSAAIDQGTSVGAPSRDIEGRVRPFDVPGVGDDGTGAGYDIGAYEVYGVLPQSCARLRWGLYE